MRSLSENNLAALTLVSLLLVAALFLLLMPARNGLVQAERALADWNIPEAINVLSTIVRVHADSVHIAELLADAYLKRGESAKAATGYDRLMELDSPHRHRYLAGKAFALLHLGRRDAASIHAREALALASDRRDTITLSRCYNLLGLVAFHEARYKAARTHQRESLRFARAGGGRAEEADALRQLGVLAWYTGNTWDAQAVFYEPALSLYRAVNDHLGEATTLSNIGHLAFESRDLLRNLRLQLQALVIRKRIGDLRGLADSYYFLGLASQSLTKGGSLPFSFFKKSVDVSASIGYEWGKEVAVRALLGVIRDNPALAAGLDAFKDSMVALSEEGKIFLKLARARKYAHQGRLKDATAEYRACIAHCDSVGYQSAVPGALVECAEALLELDSARVAERLVRKARSMGGAGWYPQFHGSVELTLAKALAASGRVNEARAVLTSLVSHLDSVFVRAVSSNSGGLEVAAATVHQNRADAYKLIAELHPTPDALFQTIECERLLPFWGPRRTFMSDDPAEEWLNALSLLDASATTFEELQHALAVAGEVRLEQLNKHAPNTPTSITTPASSLDVRRALATQEVLLEYFIGTTRIFVCAIDSGAMQVLDLPVTPADLASMVDLLREMLLLGKDSPEDGRWKAPSRALYKALVEPVIECGLLREGSRVFVATDGVLHLLPFQALLSSQRDEVDAFLIEQFMLSYVTSGTTLVNTRRTSGMVAAGQEPPGRSLLVVSAPRSVLPNVAREVRSIPTDVFESTIRLGGGKVQPSELLSGMERSDVIHIATHARMHFWYPLSSWIDLSGTKLELRDILARSIPARLVVLSACETGVSTGLMGDVPSGHDLVSFPRAFLSAGASAVVSSLWLVEDEATADLMSLFYAHLASDVFRSPGVALHRAQREFLASAQSSGLKSHPFYWAAFGVTGL